MFRRLFTSSASDSFSHTSELLPIRNQNVENVERLQSLPAERVCFICLDDNHLDEDKLVSSCTRCHAMVHQSCWSNWRSSQASNARRSRVSGIWSASDPFLCSICKSGAARLEREIVSSRWLESFVDVNRSAYAVSRNTSGLFRALSIPRTRSESEDESEDDVSDLITVRSLVGPNPFRDFPLLVVLFLTVVFTMFAQIVVWRVYGIDTQFLVLSLTVSFCVMSGIIASLVLYRYQENKYNNFFTVV